MDTVRCGNGHDLSITGKEAKHGRYCGVCAKITRQKWSEGNRNKCTEYSRKSRMKRVYGLSLEDFETLYFVQDGRCAICNSPMELRGKQTHIDHNHETGEVRGLLCHWCNLGIGMFKEDKNIFISALNYLGLGG